ncbi:class I SAM-dependent methyltransferase [Winogradskyella bathintestinalis]|uniref:Class I SAM-dependent methyltransferase n=1 Tax=Winogradskyella bathintestinalis TaxID=3035208 RepID=A0ABT7ZV57_9FLAO|nr:class I SAM-dependent methyltransferase [Winogradskyella bathintestinalis]MDN3492608.1 class I SAM-dependent methyltransferase [Winogradskyella bathintestinalis]
MSLNFDPRKILSHPVVYTSYQKIVGGYRARKLFVENNVKIKPGQKILDIGCGPGDILEFLPKVDYTGIDLDANYIAQAKKKYGNKGQFKCAGVDGLDLEENHTFDIVISAGVLHHLTDEQCFNLFEIAVKALKPNGRFISFDGCYIPNQNKISAYFLRKDRGQFVRTQPEYERLAKTYFSNVVSTIDESYFFIPYTSIIMDCKNS